MDIDKNTSAKLYFIRAFKKAIKNEYRILAKKYSPSIREILEDYIEIHLDVIKQSDNDKLIKARENLIESMTFNLKECNFLETNLNKDLEALIKVTEKKEKDYNCLYNSCSSLLKRFNDINIYEAIALLIVRTESFEYIDQLIDCLIKELTYDGYSLQYIDFWYNEQYKENKNKDNIHIDNFIDSLKLLKQEKKDFDYYFTILNDSENLNNSFISSGVQIIVANMNEIPEEYKTYLQMTELKRVFKIKLNAQDVYKGGEFLQKIINSYFLVINSINNSKIAYELCFKFIAKYNNNFIRLSTDQTDKKTLFLTNDNREKNDLIDFHKYRSKVFSSEIQTDGITIIERVFNILQSQYEQTSENRLINLWSAMEYLLSFYNGNSIIAKAKLIVPKLMTLYCLKDKLNMLWSNLRSAFEINDEAKSMVLYCQESDAPERYDIKKVIEYFETQKQESAEKFANQGGIVLKRMYLELGNFLYNPKFDRSEYIEKYHKSIACDIISIYRSRNILIHSRTETFANIDFKAVRLQQYISNTLGVIVHFKRKNPLFTISEILNSIVLTYEDYLEKLSDETDNCQIIKPKYLLLSN